MSKFTPGPWKAGHKTVTAPETEDRLPLDVRLYGGNADDNRANARLIAAAPDLFEALDGLVQAVDAAGYGTELQRNLMRAGAAIAKARGFP